MTPLFLGQSLLSHLLVTTLVVSALATFVPDFRVVSFAESATVSNPCRPREEAGCVAVAVTFMHSRDSSSEMSRRKKNARSTPPVGSWRGW